MSLRLDTKEGYWTIMSIYAPQTGCPEHVKDEFYLTLEEAIRSVPEGSRGWLGQHRLRGEGCMAECEAAGVTARAERPSPTFLDLEKSYDRLPRVPKRLMSITKDTYEGLKPTVPTTRDDKEGGYHSELEEKAQLWQRAVADNGLRLNVKKTKLVSSEQCTGTILDYQGEAIEKVKEFRTLGSDLSEKETMNQAVRGGLVQHGSNGGIHRKSLRTQMLQDTQRATSIEQ
ncbi:unnamed protein product [Heligmosomoides polygyrus]|uniref:Reverse transcriptase domain-containing protein n=1 Tax=Heligmosomoides polygyrus TaxID=6339 RepID=A0A183G5I0_HELPZ|nr:unnamed protein product [Heligmosomoides polygyrus]